MDRTPAPEPYPPVAPAPPASSSSGGGGGKGIVVAYAIGGIMVALAGVLPRAQLLLGSDVVAETKSGLQSGLSIGLVLIGVLMIVRIFTVASRVQRGGVVVLFIGPLIALFLVVQDMVRVKNVLTDWMLSTGAAQVSSQFDIPIDQVKARINQLISTGDLHVSYKIGIWLGLAGSLLALGAAVAAMFTRRPQQVSVGPGWSQPVAAGPGAHGIPLAPGATAPGAPPAPATPPPTDWTAPTSDWTAPPTSPPPAAQPAQPAAPPAPPAEPEEPESFPPPPPPPPS